LPPARRRSPSTAQGARADSADTTGLHERLDAIVIAIDELQRLARVQEERMQALLAVAGGLDAQALTPERLAAVVAERAARRAARRSVRADPSPPAAGADPNAASRLAPDEL